MLKYFFYFIISTLVINLTAEDTAINVTSPNYPNPYENNIDILWKVTTPSGCRAVVSFSVFDTESGYDFVTIFAGRSPDFEESIERVKLSGNPRLGSYKSVGSYLWLRFTSDLFSFNRSPNGFRALLSCETLIDIPLKNTQAAEVTSPNYPDPYDNNLDILWRVTAPDGYRVGLHFAEIYTEQGYDFVTVYEGRMPSIEMSMKRIHVSGHSSLHNITSAGSYLWIRFTSDRRNAYISSSPYTGFKAVLSSIPIRDSDVLPSVTPAFPILTRDDCTNNVTVVNTSDLVTILGACAAVFVFGLLLGSFIMYHIKRQPCTRQETDRPISQSPRETIDDQETRNPGPEYATTILKVQVRDDYCDGYIEVEHESDADGYQCMTSRPVFALYQDMSNERPDEESMNTEYATSILKSHSKDDYQDGYIEVEDASNLDQFQSLTSRPSPTISQDLNNERPDNHSRITVHDTPIFKFHNADDNPDGYIEVEM